MRNEYFRSYLAKRRIERKEKAIAYKGGCCEICSYDRFLPALEFHHINPEDKVFNCDSRNLSNRTWKAAQQELDKCRLLCANCHREVEYGFMGSTVNPLGS